MIDLDRPTVLHCIMDDQVQENVKAVDSQVDNEYIDELNHLLTIAKNSKTKLLLENALKQARTPDNVEVPTKNGTPSGDARSEVTAVLPKPVQVSTRPVQKSAMKISEYGWDQSDKYVKIYITSLPGLNEVTSDNISLSITEKSMKVELREVKGKSYYLLIDDLCGKIVPEESSVKTKHGIVTVSLRKTSKDSWPFLTAREKKMKDAKDKDMKPPKADKDEDPSAGLMKLMKKMYDEGDDEMKRTITKSWYESREKQNQGLGGLGGFP